MEDTQPSLAELEQWKELLVGFERCSELLKLAVENVLAGVNPVATATYLAEARGLIDGLADPLRRDIEKATAA